MCKSNEHLRKWREIQQTNNVLQRPEIYRSQKRKKPRFAARPYEYWCPDSESNQGHGDFQSPALPTELSGQRSALNRKPARSSTLFREKRFNCLTLRQSVGLCVDAECWLKSVPRPYGTGRSAECPPPDGEQYPHPPDYGSPACGSGNLPAPAPSASPPSPGHPLQAWSAVRG